ncbi:MAG: hypothetical protein II865_10560 [Bacteroidales bacterium]|jgi:hypothetical protein|nr:hypothetical protein [Bacteroidales bacterium]
MKKQITLWLAVIMLFGTITTFAQKPFAGTITFETTAEGTDDPNVAAQLAEMTQEVTIMGNNTKTVINQMGVGIINITNGDYKLATTIIDIPGYGKYYIEKEDADIKKSFETTKLDFNYTPESKEIAGYNCKKVIIKMTDLESDEEDSMVLWVTDDLLTGNDINFSTYPGLKGYPLRVEITRDVNGDELTIIQTATKVTPDKKVKASNFLRPSDSTPIKDAPDELKAMFGMTEGEE